MKLSALAACVVAVAFVASESAHAQTAPAGAPLVIKGKAVVTGPDILSIENRAVLLYGIDAPERRQMCSANGRQWDCGTAASKTLLDIVADHEVACEEKAKDAFSRSIAKCIVLGKDVALEMVNAGMAMAFRKESTDYVAAEEQAKTKKVGIWRGPFLPPWDWREMIAGHPQPR